MGEGDSGMLILHNMESFFLMGGFAKSIWSAFGVTTIIFLGLFFSTTLRYKRITRKQNASSS